MALPASGTISLNQCHIELGASSGTSVSMNDSDMRSLANVSSGAISLSNFHGKSAETSLPSGGNVNGQAQLKGINASSYISSGGTLRIPSSMWVWSDSTSTAALTIDIPCTVINDGKIIGCGGAGSTIGWQSVTTPGAGGAAINVTSSGVTITNSSGAYIAGGGGGGASSAPTHLSGTFQMGAGPGGGGAGGGSGGRGGAVSGSGNANTTITGGSYAAGGALNATGADGSYEQPTGSLYAQNGHGGGAGGGAGGQGNQQYYADAGAGGRILPGSGGSGGAVSSGGRSVAGTAGGSAGNAGVNNTTYRYYSGQPGYGGGGGGGWGASGGSSYGGYTAGGSGGAAISGTSRSLSNSGTIYGST